MNKENIKKILPHRDPFLLVDEVLELEVGSRAKGLFNVNPNLDFFKGHFPNHPVMPGVLILEALAQVGAIAALSVDEFKGKIGYLVGVDKAKFREMVLPGDILILEVEMHAFRRGFGYGFGKAYVNDKLVCEAKISFAVK